MVNTYCTRNQYFDEAIRDYLENIHPEEWVRVDEPSESTTLVDMDYPHYQDGLMPTCKIMSQMEGLDVLGNKRKQYLLMEKHKPKSIGDYIPKTYLLDPRDTENLRGIFDGRKYIVKPGWRSHRIGIFVTKDYMDFCNKLRDEIVKDKARDGYDRQKHPSDDWIIQEYIDNPLLYEGKKFHFRVFVLLVKDSRGLRVYVYDKFLMYFACDPYNPDEITNSSCLSEGVQNMKRTYPEDFVNYSDWLKYRPSIDRQVRKIVKNCVRPVASDITSNNSQIPRFKSYKILGLDILIDESAKCYLAEVNTRTIGMYDNTEHPVGSFEYEMDKKERTLVFQMYSEVLVTIFSPDHKTNFTLVGTYSKQNRRTRKKSQNHRKNRKKTQNHRKNRKNTQKKI